MTISLTATGSVLGENTGMFMSAGGKSIANSGSITGANNAALLINGAGGNTINNAGYIRSGGFGAITVSGGGNVLTNIEFMEGASGLAMSGAITNKGIIRSTELDTISLSGGGWRQRRAEHREPCRLGSRCKRSVRKHRRRQHHQQGIDRGS